VSPLSAKAKRIVSTSVKLFLEIALVISSLALLSRKRFYWVLGIISGLAGLGVAATGFLLH